jgi:predicted nucleic acid-binding protein
MTAVLVDTNVLLRRTQPLHEHFSLAVESVARLLERGDDVCFTPQIVAEFWSVATRPLANNGLGFTLAQVSAEVAKFEAVLTLLPDSPMAYPAWRRLVAANDVKGVQVHDARLVASMSAHGVRRVLTFNAADFARFDVDVLHPSAL